MSGGDGCLGSARRVFRPLHALVEASSVITSLYTVPRRVLDALDRNLTTEWSLSISISELLRLLFPDMFE